MSKICIIDYKSGGNIFSVNNSLEHIGAITQISSDPKDVLQADKIFFPGVGSFSQAIESLHKLGLYDAIKQQIQTGVPTLAICVGMQSLFNYSTEAALMVNGQRSTVNGLSIIPATVERFGSNSENFNLKIPHMGWNAVHLEHDSNPLFKGISQDTHFYFIHSYRVAMQKISNYQISSTEYGEKFISHIWNGTNLHACQFHPEKSGEAGLALLENFMKL
jgi:imidazole glycerol phosphate synthase glutamine amidotransferase subunit